MKSSGKAQKHICVQGKMIAKKINSLTYFLSDPFSNYVVGYNYYAGTSHKPQGVEGKVGVIKPPLIRVVFQCKESRIYKHAPAYRSQNNQSIASYGFINV